MPTFLILQLDGVMQAWGEHTYEDLRSTALIPTRSGLLGLLGACLGIERADVIAKKQLDESLYFTIRLETQSQHEAANRKIRPLKITDFHTVENVRKVEIHKMGEYPVISYREYLCDAKFAVALELAKSAHYTLAQITNALQKPIYTPSLGRRSCPISKPLLAAQIEAENAIEALQQWHQSAGRVYTDSPSLAHDIQWQMRDQPIYGRTRQFATRRVFVHNLKGAASD